MNERKNVTVMQSTASSEGEQWEKGSENARFRAGEGVVIHQEQVERTCRGIRAGQMTRRHCCSSARPLAHSALSPFLPADSCVLMSMELPGEKLPTSRNSLQGEGARTHTEDETRLGANLVDGGGGGSGDRGRKLGASS